MADRSPNPVRDNLGPIEDGALSRSSSKSVKQDLQSTPASDGGGHDSGSQRPVQSQSQPTSAGFAGGGASRVESAAQKRIKARVQQLADDKASERNGGVRSYPGGAGGQRGQRGGRGFTPRNERVNNKKQNKGPKGGKHGSAQRVSDYSETVVSQMADLDDQIAGCAIAVADANEEKEDAVELLVEAALEKKTLEEEKTALTAQFDAKVKLISSMNGVVSLETKKRISEFDVEYHVKMTRGAEWWASLLFFPALFLICWWLTGVNTGRLITGQFPGYWALWRFSSFVCLEVAIHLFSMWASFTYTGLQLSLGNSHIRRKSDWASFSVQAIVAGLVLIMIEVEVPVFLFSVLWDYLRVLFVLTSLFGWHKLSKWYGCKKGFWTVTGSKYDIHRYECLGQFHCAPHEDLRADVRALGENKHAALYAVLRYTRCINGRIRRGQNLVVSMEVLAQLSDGKYRSLSDHEDVVRGRIEFAAANLCTVNINKYLPLAKHDVIPSTILVSMAMHRSMVQRLEKLPF